MILIKLREPWWGAHSKFGWEKGVAGLGLNSEEVDAASGEMIEIQTRGEAYRIKADDVIDMCTKNNWTFTAKNNTVLYVVPQNKCTQVFKNQLDESFTCCCVVNVAPGTTMRCPVCKENCVTEAGDD